MSFTNSTKNTNNNTEEPQCNGTEVGVSVDSIGSKEKLMGNRNSDGLPEVNLEGLTKKQKWKVQQMLKEEADSFSREREIGDAKGLLMNIHLTDSVMFKNHVHRIHRQWSVLEKKMGTFGYAWITDN
jgi:hypothetical protein